MSKIAIRDNSHAGHRIPSGAAALFLCLMMAVISAVSAFAATQTGTGGRAYQGAGTNTFAAGMPLSEIFFVKEKFYEHPDVVEITDNTSGALELNGKRVSLLGSALEHNKADNNITGIYQSTFSDAAIMPDGTLKDVVVTFEIGRVMTARTSTGHSDANMPSRITIHNNTHSSKGINISTTTNQGSGAPNAFFGVAVEQIMTISVEGEGDFVVPFYGFNQNRNVDGSAVSLRTVHGNDGYDACIETVKVTDTDYTFYPQENDTYITTEDSQYYQRGGTEEMYDPPNKSGGKCGDDNHGYRSGFATVGQSGFQASVSSPCNENYDGPYGNNQYIALGDLVHRIWSGSGPHGSINTFKNGADGEELAGGSFTGDVPSGFPAGADSLMRYSVPDAKADVTYNMTADKGYTLEKVVVDGNEYIVPDIPEAATVIASLDGDGTLTYLGGGNFKYSFDNPNTQDHEIYVTWKKATAVVEVSKKWIDNSKAAAADVRLTSDDGFDDAQPIPLSDGLVYKWEKIPVFKYDANGDATDPVTYTLSEDSDPVSADYAKAVWSGTDKEGGTPDGGFTLTDPDKQNECREPDDTFEATVTNNLLKDVEITKVWDDQDNKFNTRPSDTAAMFTLYSDESAAEAVENPGTPTAEGSGSSETVKWTGLPAFDSDGNEIIYYAKEDVPAGYECDLPEGIVKEGEKIKNTMQTREASITKVWDDDSDDAGKRPSPSSMKSSFTLYNSESYDAADEVDVTPDITDNGDDTFTVTWKGLPIADSDGEITYYAKETTIPKDYTVSEGGSGVAEDGSITNKYEKEEPEPDPTTTEPTSKSDSHAKHTVKTGDASDAVVWVASIIVAAAAILLITARRRSRNSR